MKDIIGLNAILAAWLITAPLTLGLYAPGTPAMWSDVLAGLVLLGCSTAVVLNLPGRLLYALLAALCGLWIMSAPLLVDPPPDLPVYDVIIGALAVVISVKQIWRTISRPVDATQEYR